MTPSTTLPAKRPSLTLLGAEPWRAAIEYVAHHFSPALSAANGDGHPVLIFPGLGADGRSVAPLRRACQALGYIAFDWGRGYNTGPKGDINPWLKALASDSAQLLKEHQQTATLIGWSLGGLYARELAKLMHGRIRQVITIGTPFNADADHTHVGWLYRLLSSKPAAFDTALAKQLRTAPSVPTTSIYSRSDGIVAWQTCRHDNPVSQVQDIEIHGSHIGMGWNRSVLQVVADRLAQRPGGWRPYSPGSITTHPSNFRKRMKDDFSTHA